MVTMIYQSADELQRDLSSILQFKNGRVEKVLDASRLRQGGIDSLINTAVFADSSELRGEAREAIRESARLLGIRPASIQGGGRL
jgi:hypothetical protein